MEHVFDHRADLWLAEIVARLDHLDVGRRRPRPPRRWPVSHAAVRWHHDRGGRVMDPVAGRAIERAFMSTTDPRLDQLLGQLAQRVPVDERERRSLAAIAEHLAVLRSPFDEHADPVHVTASAIVVGVRGVVLHRHKRLGIWLQPGGHIDPGEWPHDAARREAFEETGLDVWHPSAGPQFVHLDVHPGPRGHTHLDVRYLLEAPDVAPSPPPGESPEEAWFSWDAAIALADEGLKGALQTVRAAY